MCTQVHMHLRDNEAIMHVRACACMHARMHTSVTTKPSLPTSFRPMASATMELLPCAMLAKGPACTCAQRKTDQRRSPGRVCNAPERLLPHGKLPAGQQRARRGPAAQAYMRHTVRALPAGCPWQGLSRTECCE
jgi:hypothetical protein